LVFEWDIKDQNFIDSKYEEFRPLLQKAHNLWSNFGIESCFDYLNDNLNISQRVAEWNNAERVLTDINHLIEYLTEEEKRLNLKLNSLLNHFYFSIADSRSNGGTNESLTGQRLESDENLIKIMTVHKSKGLQFPVVFCPFIYPNSALKLSRENKPQKPYVVKSKGDSLLHISKNLEGDLAKNLEKAKELQLKQEKVRTLYVAFTRAKFKLYIYKLSDLNFTDTSRKSYNTTAWASIEGLNKSHWIKENGFISRRISYYNTDGSHNLNSAHRLNQIALVPPKKLSRAIIPSWLKQSFSGLTSKSSDIFTDESVLNLYDFYEGDDEPNKSKDVIFKGAYFGTIVHDILEKIPF
jgi:exodeoxyribonuclease V beta subunit